MTIHAVQWDGTYRGTKEDPRENGWCPTCYRAVYDGEDSLHVVGPTIVCSRCRKVSPASTEWHYLNAASPTGYQRECVDCQKAMSAKRTIDRKAVKLAEYDFRIMLAAVSHLDLNQLNKLQGKILDAIDTKRTLEDRS